MARAMGATHQDLVQARTYGEAAHLPLEGQLSRLSVAEFERHWQWALPQQISGGDFMRMDLPLADARVRLHPYRSYPVRLACHAAVYDHERQSHCLGLIRQLTRQPDRATYAQLRHSFSELMLSDQKLQRRPSCVSDLLGQLDALKGRLGLIGLIPVRAAWEQSLTLWLDRPLDREAAEQLMDSLPDACQFAWLPAHPHG